MSNETSDRLGAQLDAIAASVCTLVDHNAAYESARIEVETQYCPSVYGPREKSNAVAVRMTADTEQQTLFLYPVYAGSQTDVSVGVLELTDTNTDTNILQLNYLDDGNEFDELVSTFYARLAPLPPQVPAAFYRATHRLVVAFKSEPSQTDIDALFANMDQLKSDNETALKPDNTCILLTSNNTELNTSLEQVRNQLHSRGGWHSHCVSFKRAADFHALFGISTLVLYATEPECCDALKAGVACRVWSAEATLHKLEQISFDGTPLHGQRRIHRISTLDKLLERWLAKADKLTLSSNPGNPTTAVERLSETILTPVIDRNQRPELATRLGRSLDQGHRKFKKFRESPSRFVNDSQSPLLRPFKNKRLSS